MHIATAVDEIKKHFKANVNFLGYTTTHGR